MAWPSNSPRARLIRKMRWRFAQLRAEVSAHLEHALELDREQRRAFHGKIRSLLGLV